MFVHTTYTHGISPEAVVIENHGQEIAGTTYFDTEFARRGLLYLSLNAGAARLLVPRGYEYTLAEMASGHYVIISRGTLRLPPVRQRDGTCRRLPPRRDALELLFEDGTDSPFAVHISPGQYDRMPHRSDTGRTDLQLVVYTEGPTRRLSLPARYRRVANLPCLRRWP